MGYLASFLMLTLAFAARATSSPVNGRNVLFITFDGVRHDEFFGGPDPRLAGDDHLPIFPSFWESLAPSGVVLGKASAKTEMLVSNPYYLSLPGYQSIFAGRKVACKNNECGRIQEDTFAERLVRDLKLSRNEVATIASWDHIPLAVERTEGATFINAGFQPLIDDGLDAEVQELNSSQQKDKPQWEQARFDKYTYAHAARYLQRHRPRFLFLSLNDADEWGHLDRYADYLATLRRYDAWLKELTGILAGMGEYGKNTCLIVSTDHGRGTGKSWVTHGALTFTAENVWLYTNCFAAKELDQRETYYHADIRPTIEALYGLKPIECVTGCGKSLLKNPTRKEEIAIRK